MLVKLDKCHLILTQTRGEVCQNVKHALQVLISSRQAVKALIVTAPVICLLNNKNAAVWAKFRHMFSPEAPDCSSVYLTKHLVPFSNVHV